MPSSRTGSPSPTACRGNNPRARLRGRPVSCGVLDLVLFENPLQELSERHVMACRIYSEPAPEIRRDTKIQYGFVVAARRANSDLFRGSLFHVRLFPLLRWLTN